MGSASITFSWSRTYPYAYLARVGTGQALTGTNKPNGSSFSVTNGNHYTLSAYFDASQVSGGSPCFCVQTSAGSVIASASVAPGFIGSASATWTASSAASVLYPVFSAVNVTASVGGTLVMSEPQVNTGSSMSAFSTAASINLVPDPLFANWFTGKWGTIPAEWLPLTGPLFNTRQPSLSASVTTSAGASVAEWAALLYTAAAYSAPGFVADQSLGLVAGASATGTPPSSITVPTQLANGQYAPVVQVLQTNGSLTLAVPSPVPWFNVLVGTPRLGLNLWGAGNGYFTRLEVDADNAVLDAVADIALGQLSSQQSSANSALGTTFVATDTGAVSRGAGNSWVPILQRVDTDVLSTALPAPGNPGKWYHATDTDQVWRDNGTELVQILTGSTINLFTGTPPSGIVLEYPAVWTGSSGAWVLNESAVATGWLYCLGQPLSVATYSDLFSVISYAWTWQNTSSGQLVSGSGLTGDQGKQGKQGGDYIIWGNTSGTSSPSSVTTASYQQVTSGATFCIPNLSPITSSLGLPYSANATTSSAATPPAVVPAIKL